MQLITAVRNGKIYASTQEPAASHLFNPKRKKSVLCLTERKSNKKIPLYLPSMTFFTPGVVQPPWPICDLKAVKYKTKAEFNLRVS